jgi:hypothetical protein
MEGLRVLITNWALSQRCGSELYVRDVATGLLELGHNPLVYSPTLGEVAAEIRAATIPVVDDLRCLASPPDIIHGHHHVETLTALLRFPGVPAVNFCHGWIPWQEAALRFPRVRRYVAVADQCRDRLVFEHGIPEDRVRIIPNFVDLKRFQPRAALPSFPQRALVFNNYASEDDFVPAVREACTRRGISLGVLGRGVGKVCAHPEKVLGEYDLIFACGRSALEALAVGTAVILCHKMAAGPLVTAADLDRLRAVNFGLRVLKDPLTAEHLGRQIDRYDAQDAAHVSLRIRATAGRDSALEKLVALYQEVLAERAPWSASEALEEALAVADYLSKLRPLLDGGYLAQSRARDLAWAVQDRDHLRADNVRLADDLARSEQDRNRLQADNVRLANALAVVHGSPTLRFRTQILRVPGFGGAMRSLVRFAVGKRAS